MQRSATHLQLQLPPLKPVTPASSTYVVRFRFPFGCLSASASCDENPSGSWVGEPSGVRDEDSGRASRAGELESSCWCCSSSVPSSAGDAVRVAAGGGEDFEASDEDMAFQGTLLHAAVEHESLGEVKFKT